MLTSLSSSSPGRGGASACTLGDRALFFGGADRNGELFSDLFELSLSPPSTSLARVHASGAAVDGLTREVLPPLGGHAAAAVAIAGAHAMLVFGGIASTSGASAEATSRGLSVWREGEWHILRAAPTLDGADAICRKAESEGGPLPSMGGDAPRARRAAFLVRLLAGVTPGERTGHSLSVVPPPIVLPPSSGGGVHGDGIPTLPLPQPLCTVLGGDSRCSVCVLFGGSSPQEGPLNDLFYLHVREEGRRGGGGGGVRVVTPTLPPSHECGGEGGSWEVEWEEVGTRGPAPLPRELHAAFIRPAIVQVVGDVLSSPLPPHTLVRVLQPPALVVHGGRSEGHASPRADVCVCDLHSRVWLPPCKSPYPRCASAAAPTPSGIALLQWGGQASPSALAPTRTLLRFDTGGTNAGCGEGFGCGVSGSIGLHPHTWKWDEVLIHDAASGISGDFPTHDTTHAPMQRFAGAATVLRDPARGAHACTFVSWAGMSAGEDLAEAVCIALDEGA